MNVAEGARKSMYNGELVVDNVFLRLFAMLILNPYYRINVYAGSNLPVCVG